MGGITEQGDTEGLVCFRDFLFKSVQILTCYFFFSAGPTFGPDSACIRAFDINTYVRGKEKREWGWKGEVK